MKRKIGLIVSFIGFAAMATSMMVAAYNTNPLAAVVIGGFFLFIIGVMILTSGK